MMAMMQISNHVLLPQSPPSRYLYSLYLSVTAFAGLGDQDFYTYTPVENVVMIIYLLFNVVLGAYILGTVRVCAPCSCAF